MINFSCLINEIYLFSSLSMRSWIFTFHFILFSKFSDKFSAIFSLITIPLSIYFEWSLSPFSVLNYALPVKMRRPEERSTSRSPAPSVLFHEKFAPVRGRFVSIRIDNHSSLSYLKCHFLQLSLSLLTYDTVARIAITF